RGLDRTAAAAAAAGGRGGPARGGPDRDDAPLLEEPAPGLGRGAEPELAGGVPGRDERLPRGGAALDLRDRAGADGAGARRRPFVGGHRGLLRGRQRARRSAVPAVAAAVRAPG